MGRVPELLVWKMHSVTNYHDLFFILQYSFDHVVNKTFSYFWKEEHVLIHNICFF